MIVIELKNCGNHAGLFQTVEGAKDGAQKILDEYHELYATFTKEELNGAQKLTTDTLTWEVKRLLFGAVTEEPEMGWEAETAFYAKRNGYFTLHEVEVGP